jgi:hypothetical protein
MLKQIEKPRQQSISLFQTILNRKHVGQMFAHADSATGFIQTHFY